MKSKILLTVMVLPAVFAACTSEELVPNQEQIQEQFKIDLAQRPIVGDVEFVLGDEETRATLGETFNAINFANDVDGFGARVIDALKEGKIDEHNPFSNYEITKTYASSNYLFAYDNGTWKTEALMAEGNYMFYLPYNAKFTKRTPLELVAPKEQTVKPAEEDGFRNPIAELYGGSEPAFVGYKFIDASEEGTRHQISMQHIYAYPLITLNNDWKGDNPETEDIETNWTKPFTVDSVVFVSNNLFDKVAIKHEKVQEKLNAFDIFKMVQDDESEAEEKPWIESEEKLIEVGNWIDKTKLLDAATADITETPGKASRVKVTFEGGKKIAAGDKYAFHVVLPAAKYEDLKVKVYLAGGKMFEAEYSMSKVTFAPGKRYPNEEYDFATEVPTVKKTAGTLATVSFEEISKDGIVDAEAVRPAVGAIKNLADFTAFLKTISANGKEMVEITANDAEANGKDEGEFVLDTKAGDAFTFVVNQALSDEIAKYNRGGKITFISNVKVEGQADEKKAAFDLTNYAFNGGFTLTKGAAGEGSVKKNITIKGGSWTNGKVADIENVNVEGGKLSLSANVGGTVNVSGGELTIDGTSEIAGDVTVTAGTLTVKNDVTFKGKRIVKGGTLYSNAVSFKAGDLIDGGTVSIDFAEGSEEFTLGHIEMKNGTIKVGANSSVFIDGNKYTVALKGGTIENSGVLSIGGTSNSFYSNLSNSGVVKMRSDVSKWNNYGSITNTGTLALTNNYGTIDNQQEDAVVVVADNNKALVDETTYTGVIKNGGKLTATANNSVIEITDKYAVTEITGGTGNVENTKRSKVTLGTNAVQTVSYKFTADVTGEDINGIATTANAINKFVFGGRLTLTEDGVTGVNQIKCLEFAANSGLEVDEGVDDIGLGIENIIVSSDVTMRGWNGTEGVGFTGNAVFTISRGAKLTLRDIVLAGVGSGKITMNTPNKVDEEDKSVNGEVELMGESKIYFGQDESKWGTATLTGKTSSNVSTDAYTVPD